MDRLSIQKHKHSLEYGWQLYILRWCHMTLGMDLGIWDWCMPNDWHILHCSHIPACSLEEIQWSQADKSMMDYLWPPGIQNWVHMEKADMDLKVEWMEVQLHKNNTQLVLFLNLTFFQIQENER